MPQTLSEPFHFTALPITIRFGIDARRLIREEAASLNIKRPLLVVMPDERSRKQGEHFAEALGRDNVSIFSDAKVHVPIETLNAALLQYDESRADGVIALGGGSAIGLGKLVAFKRKASSITIPTTYSGAEVTPFNAVTENGIKTQIRDAAVMPKLVLYDVALTHSLPLAIAVPSMMNALAHAVEALYAPDGNPIVSLEAEEAIRCGVPALCRLIEDQTSVSARRDLLFAAMLAGRASAVTTMALHHKLCHVLGGAHDLNHADVNCVILPHALAYNAPGAPQVMERIKHALETNDPAGRLFNVAKKGGAPTSLKAIGMPEEGLKPALETALKQTYANPVPLEEKRLMKLLQNAFYGHPPE